VSVEVVRRYHEATKHTPQSVRASARMLDWDNRPHPFKEYVGLEAEPLDVDSELGRLLRWGAGVIRTQTYPGGDEYHFRTYSSAGALYPVEVYPVTADGVFHFHPRELALRRLRSGYFRTLLSPAKTILILTGILWRTAWKYEARGYRHLWWDAGTMLANLLALAAVDGLPARVLVHFDDDEVNRLVGVDGRREAALCLLALGPEEAAPPPATVAPINYEAAPLSAREVDYPAAEEAHAASAEGSGDRDGVGNADLGLTRADLERALRRRGSVREFALEPLPRAEVAAILADALGPIPADMPPHAECYLVANAVDGVEPGAYRFDPPDNFELVRAGSFRREAGFLVLEQMLGARAAATIFFVGDLGRVLGAHGPRGYRWAQLEAGIRTGRVYIGAFARGLGATASTFYDDEVTRFFGLDEDVQPMLSAAVGQR
jgi:SagB-type dehydrogenase family enzyme